MSRGSNNQLNSKPNHQSNPEIHFVSGKGGVGKSVVALALAQKFARQGKKTLLVELGNRSFFADWMNADQMNADQMNADQMNADQMNADQMNADQMNVAPQEVKVGYDPTPFPERLGHKMDVALWSGAEALREYAQHLLKFESIVRLFFENNVSRTLIDIAPGLNELSVLGKITSGNRKVGPPLPYDVLVVDAFATGHMLALIRAPRGMLSAVRYGPMADQCQSILNVLRVSQQTFYHLVTLLEELPVIETEELKAAIFHEVGIHPQIIANMVLPKKDVDALVPAPGNLTEENFKTYIDEKRATQQGYLQRLKPDIEVPQFYCLKNSELLKAISGSFGGDL